MADRSRPRARAGHLGANTEQQVGLTLAPKTPLVTETGGAAEAAGRVRRSPILGVEAGDLAATLRARLQPDSDPALAYAIGDAQLAAGDRAVAAAIFDVTAKALGNEPTRTALRIAIGLARAAEPAHAPAAARVAIALFQAMPSLERGPVFDEMWAISRR